MKQYEIKALVEVLQNQINESEKMWKEEVSHAQIIGFLRGTIKAAITMLDAKIEK